MKPALPISSETLLPFHTYRPPLPGGGFGAAVELVSSVEHFYQAERFRGIDEALRQEILLQPTPREARNLSRSRLADQRGDWDKRRSRILACALWMQAIEYPAVVDSIKSGRYAYAGKSPFWRDAAADGTNFAKLLAYLDGRLSASWRVFVYAFGHSPNDFQFAGQMQLLFRRRRPDEVVIGTGRGLDRVVEQWAIERSIATRRRPQMARLHRSSDRAISEAMEGATHAVIFGDAAQSEVARMLRLAAEAKLACRIIEPTKGTPQLPPKPGVVLQMNGGTR